MTELEALRNGARRPKSGLGKNPTIGDELKSGFAVFITVVVYITEPAGRAGRKRGGGNDMVSKLERSSHAMLSCTDGIATGMSDALLLVGRVLIAALFFLTAWFGSPNVAYLTSLAYPDPGVMSTLAVTVEYIIIVSLVLGLATRYGALLGLLFVIIATVTAHRYWTYPQAQQGIQYIFLTKNLAVAGGLLLLFVTGAGRISVDRMLSGKG
jgi:putative oxidoreductase